MNANIQITKHGVANDCNPCIYFTVANFNKMTEVEKVEYTGTITENTMKYYEEQGYTEVTITETGERFNRKYKITMKGQQPEITKCKTFKEAQKVAKAIK